ncbi:MAG: FAD:protein FMN transferase [Lentisphaeria bacterium]|nr:FAD:protein FMN transferase [Lentisphaeria bacterium]
MKFDRRTGTAIFSMLAVAAAAIIYFAVLPHDRPVFKTAFPVMGTVAEISVYSEKELNTAFKLCKNEFDAVNRICSLFSAESELSRINANAFDAPVKCSDEMWYLLMRSKEAFIESGGKFDITVKPLMDLWGFYRKRDSEPSKEEIDAVMKKVGFDKLIFDEKEKTIRFSVPEMALDMGGIAKGYAVDRAAEALIANGINSGVIDLGGNLKLLPVAPEYKTFYHIGIKNPANKSEILPEAEKVLPGTAVSTSGHYERFVIYNGVRRSHIISVETGYPVSGSAVTVFAPKAVDADIFSTVCTIGGKDIAEKLKKKYPEIKIIFAR